MGRIIQLSTEPTLLTDEKKTLRITQWKTLRLQTQEDVLFQAGIEVLVDIRVWFIHDITLEQFNHINHKNNTETFLFEYRRSSLICDACKGSGVVDWVTKVTTHNDGKISMADLTESTKYIRNKKGPVRRLITLRDETIYTSTPRLRRGEEYCPKCKGCGIRLDTMAKHDDFINFDVC